jgi:hypothetical protein
MKFSPTSCIDCRILKKRWRDVETNDRFHYRYVDVDVDDDDVDDQNVDSTLDKITLSPWTVCQFEFDEDYLSNGDKNFKYSMHN